MSTVAAAVGSRDERWKAAVALLLLVPVPSVGTWMGLVAAPGAAGQAVFVASKIWIVMLPAVWWLFVERQRLRIPPWRKGGMVAACVTGAGIFVGIAGVYGLVRWLAAGWIDAELIGEKAMAAGLSTPGIYVAGAVYWCTINSVLEEYVWRWFVFSRCEVLFPRWAAVLAAGLFFTLHHVIALDLYFVWPVAVLASLGVFVGGATWSWLYLRYRNIWAAYVSHVFADVIIFVIGYQLIFGQGG
jgi:hypothetical protein